MAEFTAITEPPLRFDGSTGTRPQTEARRYVYAIVATMLEHEPSDPDGWIFGGIEREEDKRRLRKAIRSVSSEMRKKAKIS